MTRKTTRILMCAGLILAASAMAAKADSIVYATTGGLMRLALEKEFYTPFKKESGTDVIPFDIEVPDQWGARRSHEAHRQIRVRYRDRDRA